MVRRHTLWLCLTLLSLVILGTVVVLSTVSYHLAIDNAAYLTEFELGLHLDESDGNATHYPIERIPRILHQTWKSETLPQRWKGVTQGCRDIMPDYEYMLWTDASSREFIAEYYPWFLDTFDNYPYPIQRADAIRYFVLYHFGGIYLDLDIGCLSRIDPLLTYPVVLPKTIPVGVSNDLMFAEKGHPFMAQTIHNLVTFDHSWVLNYPTVMFSTGPMFLSAQYGLYTASHPATSDQPGGEVRILPKSLYGKNARPEEAPHAFFTHYYGSSWHAGDAGFIGFLGHWGKALMWIGSLVLFSGLLKLSISSDKRRRYTRRIGGYDVVLPRWRESDGRWQLDMGWFTIPGGVTQPSSPISLNSPVSPVDEDDLPPFSFDVRTSSPCPSEASSTDRHAYPTNTNAAQPVINAVMRAGNRVINAVSGPRNAVGRPPRRRRRGVLYFLPAIFTTQQDIELSPSHHRSPPPLPEPLLPRYTPSSTSSYPPPSDSKRRTSNEAAAPENDQSLSLNPPHSYLTSRTSSRTVSRVPSRAPSPFGEPSAAPPYSDETSRPNVSRVGSRDFSES